MNEFWSSVTRWFNEKTSSPLYFTYLCFFITWNWKFFQIIFLESESLFKSPRIEYITSMLLISIPWFSPFELMINMIWRFLPPAIFTYLAIVHLPKVHKWAYNIHIKNYFDRKDLYRQEELAYERRKVKFLKGEAEAKKEQKEQREVIEKVMTDEDRLRAEYEEFEKAPSFYKFRNILETIYQYGGFIEEGHTTHADSGALAIAHTWGLINYSADENHITLTEKGKNFARIYLEKYPL